MPQRFVSLVSFVLLGSVLVMADTAVAQNSCDAGKLKCVQKKVTCLLKVYEVAKKKALAPDAAKLQNCRDKFDGGASPEKGCFAKLEAKNPADCSTTGNADYLEAQIDQKVQNLLGFGGVVVAVAGPTTNPANGHTYYLASRSSWTLAEAWAATLGGHLVTINDAAEQGWVFDTFSADGGVNRALWVGLTAPDALGPYGWTSGDALTYTNWAAGEPNDPAGFPDERYVHMYCPEHPSAGQWNNGQDAALNVLCGTPSGVVEVAP